MLGRAAARIAHFWLTLYGVVLYRLFALGYGYVEIAFTYVGGSLVAYNKYRQSLRKVIEVAGFLRQDSRFIRFVTVEVRVITCRKGMVKACSRRVFLG